MRKCVEMGHCIVRRGQRTSHVTASGWLEQRSLVVGKAVTSGWKGGYWWLERPLLVVGKAIRAPGAPHGSPNSLYGSPPPRLTLPQHACIGSLFRDHSPPPGRTCVGTPSCIPPLLLRPPPPADGHLIDDGLPMTWGTLLLLVTIFAAFSGTVCVVLECLVQRGKRKRPIYRRLPDYGSGGDELPPAEGKHPIVRIKETPTLISPLVQSFTPTPSRGSWLSLGAGYSQHSTSPSWSPAETL